MIEDWPTCPYCGEGLESEMLYTDAGPRLVLFCTCDTYCDMENDLQENLTEILKDID